MFDGIDDLDWESRHHAYGPATDVPDDLRALRSPDAEVRKQARWNLYGNIFHQGTRYRASRLAVKFLIQLAVEPETPEREQIIDLITHLALGYPETYWRIPVDRSGLGSGDEYFERGENEYHADERDVYDEVCRHASSLVRLAADPSASVRSSACLCLGLLPDAGDELMTVLSERANDDEDAAQAMAIIAYALARRTRSSHAPLDVDRHRDTEDPTLRLAAAVSTAWAGEGALAIEGLLAASSEIADDQLPQLFAEGVEPFVADTLTGSGALDEHATRTLTQRVPALDPIAAVTVVGILLAALFPNADVPSTPDELSAAQRDLLEAIAQARAWRTKHGEFVNFTRLMRGWALPHTRKGVQEYLDGMPLREAIRVSDR